MKLHHFRNISAIVEHGSLRAAARHLGIAQPALSRSITELERELGAALFERRPRGMALTAIGQTFARRAGVILNEVKRLNDDLHQFKGEVSGTIVVGLSITAHLAILPQILRRFYDRYPKVELNLIEGSYPSLESRLLDGTIDFYIGPESDAKLSAELIREQLFENTRAIIARHGHPLVKVRSLKGLVKADWASTSVTHRADAEIGALFKDNGLPAPRPILRCQSGLTLMVTLAHSDLLALLPVQWAASPLFEQALTTIRVREKLPGPRVGIVRRGGLPLTPAAEYFLDLVHRRIGHMTNEGRPEQAVDGH